MWCCCDKSLKMWWVEWNGSVFLAKMGVFLAKMGVFLAKMGVFLAKMVLRCFNLCGQKKAFYNNDKIFGDV